MKPSPLLAIVLSAAATAGACRPRAGIATEPPSLTPAAPSLPRPDTSRDVDAMLRAEWTRRGIVPARPVDDERFFRRVSLDIVGRIPTLAEIDAFAGDQAEGRRARAVDRLLESKGYAEHWANYWSSVLLGDDVRAKVIDEAGFRGWLSAEFVKNTPWNDLVFALVSASGINRDMEGQEHLAPESAETKAANPAVNWLLKYKDTPQDLAGNVASTFLGVRIQCAQCHDHKTEKWTQEDFRRFAACFMRTRAFTVDRDMGGPRRFELEDVAKAPAKLAKNPELEPYARAEPRGLDGADLSREPNRRQALGRWLTSPRNPWFAKAIVNRLWGELLGQGFVEPVDDFRTGNPAVLPELLDRLAEDFVVRGYDLKILLKTIVATEAYQLSSEAPPSPSDPGAVFSRFPLKPLGPDQLLDSVAVATDLDQMLLARKDGDLAKAKAQMRKQYNFLFDVDEESHPTSYEGTIAQALLLMNGGPVARVTHTARAGALLKVLSMPQDDEHRLETLFLRALARRPTAEEKRTLLPFVAEKGGQKLQRYEDLLWALLNSSEFVFNH